MIISVFLLAACADPVSEITLTGQVLGEREGTTGMAEVTVTLRDGQTEVYAETTTDADGMFQIPSPANTAYHLSLSGDEIVTTAFSGIVGAQDTEIPAGELWIHTEAGIEGFRAAFENCPNADAIGGMVEGEVWYRIQNQQTDDHLVAEEAQVKVFDNDGSEYTVCYLDNDGISSGDAQAVGATGQFMAFGLPEAPITVEFIQAIGSANIATYGFVFLPKNAIAPFHPAFIEFP